MAKVKYIPTDDMPLTTTNLGYEFDSRKTTTVDDEAALKVFKGHPHFEVSGEKEDKPEKSKSTATPPAAPVLHAAETAKGKWSIMHGENEIKSGLTKDDADAFNALSAEDKAEYIK